MALTKISRSLLDTGISDSSDATAITIDSSENVGIACTPHFPFDVQLNSSRRIGFNYSDSQNSILSHDGSGNIETLGLRGNTILFYSDYDASNPDGVERMRIDSSGNVGIGTTSPSFDLDIQDTSNTYLNVQATATSGEASLALKGKNSSGTDRTLLFKYDNSDLFRIATPSAVDIRFETSDAERMRITSSGGVLIGQTSSAQPVVADIAGIGFSASGLAEFQVNGGTVMRVGRLTNDGDLVEFRAQTQVEGKISVSGSTVSYEGFSGCHESSGIATDTVIGTVCSTIDELDTYVSGNKSGQTRAEHAKIKVSDTVGDSRVYGVLSSYSETDNKPIVCSVGIGSVRVTGACNGGDLLESNGDGTAKVQDDDIIRSKTIGKVTIGNSNAGVKLVSCVLYCG